MTGKRLAKILDNAPELKGILAGDRPLEKKRVRIRAFLSKTLNKLFEDNPDIHHLEWILARDANRTFRHILSRRSERLADFSLLAYLDDMLHRPSQLKYKATPGFFAEMDHLVRGVAGNTGIYSDKKPAFIQHQGAKAAVLRSRDLSRMARDANHFMRRYPCGLDPEVIRRRYGNRSRILKHFKATELEWEDWKWHTRNIIRNERALKAVIGLTQEEEAAIALARKHKIPFGITPHYLSLMDPEPDRRYDYAVRAQVIPPLNYVESHISQRERCEQSMDFMLERDTSPIEGITRRYPMICILKPILTCPQICVYCQRNWEITDVYSRQAALAPDKLEKAIRWIAETPEIMEVLVTGGDPLLLSNAKIENLLFRLSKIEHVERIRIGTRTPVTLPQRITDALVRDIGHFHNPGRREIVIVTHFEHPYEITPQSLDAVQKFRRYGMSVKNQAVYTFYNSRKFEAAYLRHKLRMIGVSPYYTFNTKGKEETEAYRVPIARLIQEYNEEARLMPGTVRTDGVVFNVPRLGKNNLMDAEHHDVISILPDGRRMYEFHPWEKKLSLADTYVYTDVSIHRYLQRLKAAGENLARYKTIWYYY